jgi:predicted lipid-binding transport protein (Tim44 family)
MRGVHKAFIGGLVIGAVTGMLGANALGVFVAGIAGMFATAAMLDLTARRRG